MMLSEDNILDLLGPLQILKECSVCPRNCKANRFSNKLGYCKSSAGFDISSICIHKGEEPVITGQNGICNIFFSHCNLQCIYCQNHQISGNNLVHKNNKNNLKEVLNVITNILDSGVEAVGFVSPSHYVPQVMIIIKALNTMGYHPFFVYNTNAYDKVDTLKELDGWIDVYLPDFKYINSTLAKNFSDASNYPEFAKLAIKEMYRQKGSTLIVNENHQAESGLIIRHLVLPGFVDESISILRYIAEEISTSVHISLMSQYYPTKKVAGHPFLKNNLSREEYEKVVNEMENLDFINGWIQELNSAQNYRPDFDLSHPFEF